MIKPNTHTNLSIDHSLPTTKSEWVAHELRKAIFAGELKPGDTLLQDTLAEQFGVSSTPVREAFRQLVAEGLVLLRPHKSAEIVQPAYTASQIKELYLIRKVLEGLAIEIAVPNLTDDDLKDLQRYNVTTQASESKVMGYWLHLILLMA